MSQSNKLQPRVHNGKVSKVEKLGPKHNSNALKKNCASERMNRLRKYLVDENGSSKDTMQMLNKISTCVNLVPTPQSIVKSKKPENSVQIGDLIINKKKLPDLTASQKRGHVIKNKINLHSARFRPKFSPPPLKLSPQKLSKVLEPEQPRSAPSKITALFNSVTSALLGSKKKVENASSKNNTECDKAGLKSASPNSSWSLINFSFSTSPQKMENKSTKNDPVPMEWAPSDDDSIIEPISPIPQQTTSNQNENDLFIVVDTNIFISHLKLVGRIARLETNCRKSIVYIPWMVFEELDYLKSDRKNTKTSQSAQNAIKYINEHIKISNGRFMAQTVKDAFTQESYGLSQDNNILSALLQVNEKYSGSVMLLSNDVNVRNKALIHNIPAHSSEDILNEIKLFLKKSSKRYRILDKMKILCIKVIEECAKNTYGDVWNKMESFKTTPQSLEDCLKIVEKYWKSVFEHILLKQCRMVLENLSAFLAKNNEDSSIETNKLEELVILCVRVCLFFKDVQNCKVLVEETIRNLNTIKDSS